MDVLKEHDKMREVEKLKDEKFRYALVVSSCLQGVTLVYAYCCSKNAESTFPSPGRWGNGQVGSLTNSKIQVFIGWSEAAV